jgi:hypothetical protein
MVDATFGKQQFVGKVAGAVTDHYTMLKVFKLINFRKLDLEVMEEYSKFKIKLLKIIVHVNN